MLLQQGVAALEIWLERSVPVDVMRNSFYFLFDELKRYELINLKTFSIELLVLVDTTKVQSRFLDS